MENKYLKLYIPLNNEIGRSWWGRCPFGKGIEYPSASFLRGSNILTTGPMSRASSGVSWRVEFTMVTRKSRKDQVVKPLPNGRTFHDLIHGGDPITTYKSWDDPPKLPNPQEIAGPNYRPAMKGNQWVFIVP